MKRNNKYRFVCGMTRNTCGKTQHPRHGSKPHHVEGRENSRGSMVGVLEPRHRLSLSNQQSRVEPLPRLRPSKSKTKKTHAYHTNTHTNTAVGVRVKNKKHTHTKMHSKNKTQKYTTQNKNHTCATVRTHTGKYIYTHTYIHKKPLAHSSCPPQARLPWDHPH